MHFYARYKMLLCNICIRQHVDLSQSPEFSLVKFGFDIRYLSPISASKYMKIALIIVVLFPFLTFGQHKMTDAEFSGLIGSVKTVIERQTFSSLDKSVTVEQPRKFIKVSDFDRQGRNTLIRKYGTGKQTVFVDINDTIVWIEQELDETEPYDEERVLKPVTISIPTEISETMMPQHRYKRDEKGRIIWRSGYAEDGRQRSITLYSYNDRGLNTEWRLFGTPSGNVITSLWYNDHNFPLEHRQFTSGATNTIEYNGYKYDSTGNWTERFVRDLGFTQYDTELKRKTRSTVIEHRENRTIVYY